MAFSFLLFFSCFINVSAEWAGNPNPTTPGSTPSTTTQECQEYKRNSDCNNGGVHESNITAICNRLQKKCEASNYATETYPTCKKMCQLQGSECSRNLCAARCKQSGLDKIKNAGMVNRWKELELTAFDKKMLNEIKECNKNGKKKYENYKETINSTKKEEESENFWDNLFKGSQATNKCGNILSDRALKLLVQIYKTITQIAVVVVIILGMLDFFKATSVDDADAMKKVWQRFIKRLVTVILLVMLPFILEFILSVFGDEAMRTCLNEFH